MANASSFSDSYSEDIPFPPLFYGTEEENPNTHLRNFEAWHLLVFVVKLALIGHILDASPIHLEIILECGLILCLLALFPLGYCFRLSF